jgi:hypothetical protein
VEPWPSEQLFRHLVAEATGAELSLGGGRLSLQGLQIGGEIASTVVLTVLRLTSTVLEVDTGAPAVCVHFVL